MLDRDAWRALSALFAAYQECILLGKYDGLRRELATLLRDQDMPLLEIDAAAWGEFERTTDCPTPGFRVCGSLAPVWCSFEFDLASGELLDGCLAWDLFQPESWSGGHHYTKSYYDGDRDVPRAVLILHAARGAGDYRVAVRRLPVPK